MRGEYIVIILAKNMSRQLLKRELNKELKRRMLKLNHQLVIQKQRNV